MRSARIFRPALLLLPLLAITTACNRGSGDDTTGEVITKTGKAEQSKDKVVAVQGPQLGTPMAQRVAVLGLLNKRNGQTRDIELKPGEAIRFGKVVIRLRACEKTAPWETYPDEGAFVQLLIRERPPGTTEPEQWRRVFSGWLFKENPAANVVQHPIYDVWVKACKMSFPGDDAPPPSPEAREEAAKPAAVPARAPSSKAQSAPATPPAAASKAPAEPATAN